MRCPHGRDVGTPPCTTNCPRRHDENFCECVQALLTYACGDLDQPMQPVVDFWQNPRVPVEHR